MAGTGRRMRGVGRPAAERPAAGRTVQGTSRSRPLFFPQTPRQGPAQSSRFPLTSSPPTCSVSPRGHREPRPQFEQPPPRSSRPPGGAELSPATAGQSATWHREIKKGGGSRHVPPTGHTRKGGGVAPPQPPPDERPGTPALPTRDTASQTSRTRLRVTHQGGKGAPYGAGSRTSGSRSVLFPCPPPSSAHIPLVPSPLPPLRPQRSAELEPDAATTAATSDLHSPAAAPPERRLGTARSAVRGATRSCRQRGRGGGAGPPRRGTRSWPAGSAGAACPVSLRAGDLTLEPALRSPPPFHFPRDSQPVWRRRPRRLLPGLQGIPGQPR